MKYSIKEIADINRNSLKKEELKKIVYLDTANLTKNKINELVDYDTKIDKIPSRAKRKVEDNDILISTVRPNQEHYGILKNTPDNLIVSTGFAVITPKSNLVDPYYLYALLTQKKITNYLQVVAENSTSAYPSIKPSVIANLEIDLLTLNKQKSIGKFFKSLEYKIELNNQIISNLEELASTLFKRWFVDFEFPDENGNPYKSSGGKMVDSELGEIPEYFQVKKLSDIADVIGGGTPSKKVKEYFEDGNISWITPKDLSINKNIFIDRGKTSITRLGLDKSSAKLLPKNSILFSSRAPIGYTAISKNELATNQGFKSLIALDGIPYQFIFHFIRNNVSKFESIATGSTFKEVSGTAVKNFKIVLPTEEVLQNYADVTSPLFKKIKIVEEENTILTELRDSLLPKLLSGEIELTEDEGV